MEKSSTKSTASTASTSKSPNSADTGKPSDSASDTSSASVSDRSPNQTLADAQAHPGDPQAQLTGDLAAMDINPNLQDDALLAIQQKATSELQARNKQ